METSGVAQCSGKQSQQPEIIFGMCMGCATSGRAVPQGTCLTGLDKPEMCLTGLPAISCMYSQGSSLLLIAKKDNRFTEVTSSSQQCLSELLLIVPAQPRCSCRQSSDFAGLAGGPGLQLVFLQLPTPATAGETAQVRCAGCCTPGVLLQQSYILSLGVPAKN